MSKKKRKSYSREFKMEAVGLITEKGYSIAEASRNLGIDYSVLRRWKNKKRLGFASSYDPTRNIDSSESW